MDETDLNQIDNTSITKTHEEILKMLEEIKEFEKKYGIYELEETIIEKESLDFEYVKFEEIKPDLVYFKEVEEKKPNILDKIKKFKIDFKLFRKKEVTEKIQKPTNPTTFRLRVNQDGVLENIDIKKPQPKKKIRLSFKRKGKKQSDSSEGKTKLSKITNVLGKIKRIIPKRGKEEESEPQEPDTNKDSE
jgi:hypothetical protein